MNINPQDLYYTYDTKGYMLYYKDQPIGGAGIDKHAKGCRANLKLFSELGAHEKRCILNGYGRTDLVKNIQAIIDKEEI